MAVSAACRSVPFSVRRGKRYRGEFALGDMNHLMDAAARGIGLEIPEAVGGAGVEAKAAVDAAGVVLVRGNLAGDGG